MSRTGNLGQLLLLNFRSQYKYSERCAGVCSCVQFTLSKAVRQITQQCNPNVISRCELVCRFNLPEKLVKTCGKLTKTYDYRVPAGD